MNTISIEVYDGTNWRPVERGVPNLGVYVNHAMQEAARSYPGRRIRAVSGRFDAPRTAPY